MTYDVVIAGGGPNGLMLACELRLAGVRPLVLEREREHGGRPIRAQGLVGRVVQLLDRRGLFARLADGRATPVPMPYFNFGGLYLDLRRLDDNPLYLLPVAQPQFEQALERRALELGAEIRRGYEVLGFTQDDRGVRVEARGDGAVHVFEAEYLVGCDGSSSTVRKQAGIGFPDTGDQDVVLRAADVVLPDSVLGGESGPTDLLQRDRWLELPELGRVPFGMTRTAAGVFAIGIFKPGVHVVGVTEWGRSSVDQNIEMTLDELRESIRRVLGADLPLGVPAGPGPHRLFRICGNSRQADRYREGRVLLAGDAAHVHGAINGPGLNLGLQDTVNLAWKLAGSVLGWAPPGLLDTYYAERHPVGERVLMSTQAQTALLAPGTDVTALRGVFGELLESDHGVRTVARLMAGADVRYASGPLDLADAHPLTGRWAPDLDLRTADGESDGRVRLAELLRNARPLLLDLSATATLAQCAAGWKDRVDLVVAACGDQAVPARALLVRPDGYVAWATDSPDATAELDALRTVLEYWFGPGS